MQKPLAVDKMEKIAKSKNQSIIKAAEIFGEDGIEELDKLISELDRRKLERSSDGTGGFHGRTPYEKYEPMFNLDAD